MRCPDCGATVRGVTTCGPSEHFLDPCGCRVSELTAREFAGDVDSGRGLATDGGTSAISDRATDEMSLSELREEFSELQECVDFWEPYEGQEAAWDRRDELWKALRERSDVAVPECSECDGRRWGQAPGDPVECLECGWTANQDVEEAVQSAWDAIVDGPDDGPEIATDGGVSDSTPTTVRVEITDEEVTWHTSDIAYEHLHNHPTGNLVAEIESDVSTRDGSLFDVVVPSSGDYRVNEVDAE